MTLVGEDDDDAADDGADAGVRMAERGSTLISRVLSCCLLACLCRRDLIVVLYCRWKNDRQDLFYCSICGCGRDTGAEASPCEEEKKMKHER